jgi:hypothetical protein
MCYIGPPFEHDVFVSYAHAEEETGSALLLKWSHHVIDRITNLLKTRFNPLQGPGSHIDVFIDKNVLQSGEKLSEELKKAVETSAFLLVLMSPSYSGSGWCKEELERHFANAESEGRTGHCVVVRAQHLPDNAWPDRLKDDRGGPVLYRDLVDPKTQLPLGLDDFEDSSLRDGVKQVFIELSQKLEEYRKYLADRRIYDNPIQAPPEKPVIYLYGRPQDLQAWEHTRQKLRMKAIVSPANLTAAAEDVFSAEKRKQKLLEYSLCDGLALLRASDNDIRLDVMTIYRDRQRLYQEHHINIPWAIIDQVGGELRVVADYQVPRVLVSDPDWPDRLLKTLSLR